MKILEQIRTVRECKNLSQEDMAERLGITVSGYSKLERGENRMHVDTFYIRDNHQISQSPMCHSSYYYVVGDSAVEQMAAQIKHQNELLQEKQILIQQQAEQLKMAQEMITLLKTKHK
ncbi:helix-turn-helix domain-containing protein [Conchiformibius steedae]|uniref:XRE family transcriptional regulator n=1 Tax=Conchiformibius steedae TaxID=153493 RepID=A0A3P2A495_9NEIS|nr:helix-turn-helix transcriptional regulator [Conchiformibius steedae]RRD89738.1 XRE family transcriptional regulator [Conchiformibius steedae]